MSIQARTFLQTCFCRTRSLHSSRTFATAFRSQQTAPKKSSDRYRSITERVSAGLRRDILLNIAFRGRVVFAEKASTTESSHFTSPILKKIENGLASHAVRSESEQLMPSLTDKELFETISGLVHLPSSRRSDDLLELIEAECCRRARQLDGISLLYIADAFFVMRYHSSAYISAIFREFDHRWENMSVCKEDVLQLAFFASLVRRCPQTLMHSIEDFANANAERFCASEFALLCHAFFVTNTPFYDYTTTVKLSNIVLREVEKKSIKLHTLGNILKSLRHVQFAKVSFCQELANALSQSNVVEDNPTLTDLVNVTFTYASLKMANPNLFAVIASAVKKIVLASEPSGREIRTKDLSRLIWSYAALCEPLDSVVHKKLVDLFESNTRLMHKYPEAFIEGLVGLVMCDVYPVNLLQVAFSPTFLQKTSGRRHEQEFQINLLNVAARIESKDFDRIPITNKVAVELSAAVGLGNVKKELCTRQGLMSLLTTLHGLLGDPAYTCCHFILAFSRIADVEIRLDSNASPIKFNTTTDDVDILKSIPPSEYRFLTDVGVASELSITEQLLQQADDSSDARADPECLHIKAERAVDSSGRRIVIKIMGWNQYAANEPLLLGVPRMELRLLARSGYEVFLISPRQAQNLDKMSPEQRTDFVKDILVNRLGVSLP